MISKIFSIRLINFTQKRGARIHYNFFNDEHGNKIRYSIVDWKDFENDMLYWKYLTVGAIMQKPYKEIINEDPSNINDLKEANIKNTISYILLMMINPNAENSTTVIHEKDLYRKILSIPILRSRFKILNLDVHDYNIDEIVETCYLELREMYLPVIKELQGVDVYYNSTKETINLKNTKKLREVLIYELPSQMISGIVVRDNPEDALSDQEEDIEPKENKSTRIKRLKANCVFCKIHGRNKKRVDKMRSSLNERVRISFINNYTTYKQILIQNQLRKILNNHRNSRVYLIMMSKWFFIIFWAFKLLVKISILFFIYKKS